MGNDWLNHKAKSYYSQNGEDGIIEAIFDSLQISKGWVVEFGAWNGKYNSNTYHFLNSGAFQGVLIEGDPKKYVDLINSLHGKPHIHAINQYVGWQGESALHAILKKTPIPTDFELLSIDVDGTDYTIWNGLKEYFPKVVVIEYNPTIPNEVEFVQEDSASVNHGNSLASLVKLGKHKGYELAATTVNNAFFVRKDLFPLLNIQDNSLHQLRSADTRITYFFSGYDGTVFLAGYQKLDLHKIPLRARRFQILPKFLRGYDHQPGIRKFLYRIYKSLYKRNIV